MMATENSKQMTKVGCGTCACSEKATELAHLLHEASVYVLAAMSGGATRDDLIRRIGEALEG